MFQINHKLLETQTATLATTIKTQTQPATISIVWYIASLLFTELTQDFHGHNNNNNNKKPKNQKNEKRTNQIILPLRKTTNVQSRQASCSSPYQEHGACPRSYCRSGTQRTAKREREREREREKDIMGTIAIHVNMQHATCNTATIK